MTDESRAPEPQPPSGRSTDVESVANISAILSAVAAAVAAVAVTAVAVVTVDANISAVLSAVAVAAVAVVIGVVSSAAFITFIGKAVRGVSRLRLALRQTGVAAPFAVAVWIGGRNRRWQAEPWGVDLTTSPRPIRYSLGLLGAAVRMRLYDLGGMLVKAARWVLASNRRTWWPLGPLLTFAAVNIHLSQGWGSAFYTLLGIVGFHSGVEWLRRRWGIEVKPKLSAGDPGGDQ